MKSTPQTEVKMRNIVLLRIDDRLLHGQVVVSWIPRLNVNEVLVIDDEYAKDEFMKEIIKNSGPENISVYVLTAEDSIPFIKEGSERNRVLVLSRNIENAVRLSKSVKIESVNIGGLGAAPGRKRYYNSIHLSENELDILKSIAKNNIRVEVKMLPNEKSILIDGK